MEKTNCPSRCTGPCDGQLQPVKRSVELSFNIQTGWKLPDIKQQQSASNFNEPLNYNTEAGWQPLWYQTFTAHQINASRHNLEQEEEVK